MDKRIGQRKTGKLLAAAVGAAGLAGLGTSQADASLVIDVRAISSTGGTVEGPKNVTLSALGNTVTLGVYAVVSGTNGTVDETFNSAGGLLNSVGSLKGNLSGGTFAGYSDASSQNGSVIDWDSDGDLDIGLSPTNSSGTGKFFARNATTGGVAVTAIDSQSGQSLIGQFVFTYTGGTDDTTVKFTVRNANGANVTTAALWFEDGTSRSPATSSFSANPTGVLIVVPEPASLGLMGLASLGLLGRRRKA